VRVDYLITTDEDLNHARGDRTQKQEGYSFDEDTKKSGCEAGNLVANEYDQFYSVRLC